MAEIVSRLTRAACAPRDAYLVVQREACGRFIGQPLTTAAQTRTPLVAATDTQLFRDFAVRLFTARSPSVGDSLAQLVGKRRGGRLARALDVTDALPTRVPARRWLELFDATVAVTGDELRWRVGQAERPPREQQHRL